MLRILVCLLAFGYITRSAGQNLGQGLVACYSFTGNANDGSGKNSHGTVYGATPTTDRFGSANSAYHFNGVDSYISIPAQELANSTYSYSAWVFVPNGVSIGNHQIIFVGDAIGKGQSLSLLSEARNDSDNNLYIYHQSHSQGSDYIVGSGGNMLLWTTLGTWNHVVVTRYANQHDIFLNGQFIVGGGIGGNLLLPYYGNSPQGMIGAKADLTEFFSGSIDDIAIYNRILSDQEIQSLYQQGLPCAPTDGPIVDDVSICGPGSSTLTARGGTTYRWYDSQTGGNFLFQGNPFITPVLTSDTDYYVSQVSGNGESARTKASVKVVPAPTIECNSPEFLFAGDELFVSTTTSSGTPPYSYTYDFGDGTTVNTTNTSASHLYTNEGSFFLNVTAQDVNQCTASCSKNIEVMRLPTPENQSRCGSGAVSLECETGYFCRWFESVTGGNPVFEGAVFTTPGLGESTDYFVSYVKNDIESKRAKVSAILHPVPLVTCISPEAAARNSAFTVSASVTGGTAPFAYVFNLGGIPKSGEEPESTHIYTQAGIFPFDISVTDANNCADSCDGTIRVFDIYIPNVITVNGDSFNDRLTLFGRIDNDFITYSDVPDFSLQIINRYGNEIFRTSDIAHGWRGERADAGTYFYQIRLGENHYRGWVAVVK